MTDDNEAPASRNRLKERLAMLDKLLTDAWKEYEADPGKKQSDRLNNLIKQEQATIELMARQPDDPGVDVDKDPDEESLQRAINYILEALPLEFHEEVVHYLGKSLIEEHEFSAQQLGIPVPDDEGPEEKRERMRKRQAQRDRWRVSRHKWAKQHGVDDGAKVQDYEQDDTESIDPKVARRLHARGRNHK